MNAKQMFVASVVAVSIGGAFVSAAKADEGSQGPTRAEVKAMVLQARANGTLIPAGEAAQPMAYPMAASTRTRAELRTEVLQARAQGELIPSGEAIAPFEPMSYSTLARAEVRESVRIARANGELIPSGEGLGPVDRAARSWRGATVVATAHR